MSRVRTAATHMGWPYKGSLSLYIYMAPHTGPSHIPSHNPDHRILHSRNRTSFTAARAPCAAHRPMDTVRRALVSQSASPPARQQASQSVSQPVSKSLSQSVNILTSVSVNVRVDFSVRVGVRVRVGMSVSLSTSVSTCESAAWSASEYLPVSHSASRSGLSPGWRSEPAARPVSEFESMSVS